MTQREKFLAALTARGWTEAKGDPRYDLQRRFIVLTHPHRPQTKVFVGKSGAVRFGRTVTESVPMSDNHKAQLLRTPIGPTIAA